MIILKICQKNSLDIIAMTPWRILGLYCAHIAQLMTHLAIYTLLFTLKLCCKPLDILQRVTKSQKVHISKDDGLADFTTSTLLKIGSRIPRSSRNTSFHEKILSLTSNRYFISWLQSIYQIHICRKPSVPTKVF